MLDNLLVDDGLEIVPKFAEASGSLIGNNGNHVIVVAFELSVNTFGSFSCFCAVI